MRNIFLFLVLLLISPVSYGEIITSDSWIVANGDGTIIREINSNEVRSIASISKLVTAMIILDAKQDMNEHFTVRMLHYNFNFTRQQLLQMALIRSNNKAATALCDNYPGGRVACINAMNQKVKDMGLINTHFIDPTGLNEGNVSTAKELVTIVIVAQGYPEIVDAGSTNIYKVEMKIRHKKKRKTLAFYNTNHDAGKGIYNFVISKTGYLHIAGGCIAMMIESTEFGRRIVVLLGSKGTKTRVEEAEYLAKYADEI
jgi:D-alanyl-D-alanine endopeptidase (penicillin-binding protein 7)